MAKSRARPEAAEVAPPAKRRKAEAGGFEDILLNAKGGKKLAPAHTTKINGAGSTRVKEGNVTVSAANGHGDVVDAGGRKGKREVVEISSEESSDPGESEEDEEEEEGVEGAPAANGAANGAVNGFAQSDEEREEDATAGANNDPMDEDEEEATFGERLYAQDSEPIDVEGVLAQEESSNQAQNQPAQAVISAPTGATFSTVLSQALRTNDNALLEVCFNTSDLESVRETLSRLDSRLVVPLLRRISERISKAPGRLGNLMVWVQWGVIAHGGYFIGQHEFFKKLDALYRLIEARAQGLQPLLQLKGKLDMLAAQFDLRREELERHVREEEDEEDAIAIYVEGESDVEEDSDEDALDAEQKLLLNGLGGDDAESDEEGVPMGAFANGIVRGDVEASDSDDGEDGFIDDEASESDGEEDDDEDDEDSDDEDDE